MDKVITIPKKTIIAIDGEKRVPVNPLLHYLGVVIENVPTKSDTETGVAHSIRVKIDALAEDATAITLASAEIDFVRDGIARLREHNAVSGSGWYYLIDGLRSATEIKN